MDADIMKNFRVNYRKKHMPYVLAQISDDWNVYEMVNEVYVIQAIE